MTRKMRCWYEWDKRQIVTRKVDIEKESWHKIVGSQSESRSMQSISLTRGVEGFTKLGLEPPSSSEPRAIPEPILSASSLLGTGCQEPSWDRIISFSSSGNSGALI